MNSADPRSDDELVRASADGDADAFEALYRRYRDWVACVALRFTDDRDAALDVLQDTFAYLVRKLPRLRLTARMTTFLYPVVKHLAATERRRRRAFITDDDLLRDLPAPDVSSLDASRRELSAVLAHLPEVHREVLIMRFVDDMPLARIARALDVPLGTVKSRLHHALAALREDPRTRRYFTE